MNRGLKVDLQRHTILNKGSCGAQCTVLHSVHVLSRFMFFMLLWVNVWAHSGGWLGGQLSYRGLNSRSLTVEGCHFQGTV